ncbi:hypothetical protein FHL15_004003 [Xylaria flabelliformis]|uniref:Uncharacterized protein n=1 Tax=Xylaria flabelliformis TaxID=2512241 RepID=A0A553I3Y3_9PEZI|nr:hypothetical protein FHL15_004003 [Xylaria flabelliformis]
MTLCRPLALLSKEHHEAPSASRRFPVAYSADPSSVRQVTKSESGGDTCPPRDGAYSAPIMLNFPQAGEEVHRALSTIMGRFTSKPQPTRDVIDNTTYHRRSMGYAILFLCDTLRVAALPSNIWGPWDHGSRIEAPRGMQLSADTVGRWVVGTTPFLDLGEAIAPAFHLSTSLPSISHLMPVELRKRKAPAVAPVPEPPAKKQSKVSMDMTATGRGGRMLPYSSRKDCATRRLDHYAGIRERARCRQLRMIGETPGPDWNQW